MKKLIRQLMAGVTACMVLFGIAACSAQAALPSGDSLGVGSLFGQPVTVPEPATIAFLGMGLVGVLLFRHRRK